MKITRVLSSLAIAVALGSTFVAMKTALAFDNILFDFNAINAKANGNAKGVKGAKGGGKLPDGLDIDVTLQASPDTFEAVVNDAPDPDSDTITGTYARKNEFSKKLTLLPDQAGLDAIVDQYIAQIELETEDEGVTAIVSSLGVTKQNLRLSVKTKKKTGTASGRLSGKLTMEGIGSIPEIGVNNVSFRVKANFKGKSANEVPLSSIEVGDT